MDNYVSAGEVVPFTAESGGAVKDTVYLIGSLLVVATVSVAEGVVSSGLVTGIIEYAKVSAQSWSEGAKVYWDDTAKNFTTTSSGNTLAGVAAAAAANPSATGKVRLDGVAR